MRRPLSTEERLLWTADPLPPMNYCLLVRIAGQISAGAVRQAAQLLRGQFPSAFMRIHIDEQDRGWLDSHGVPEVTVREASAGTDWRRVLEEELGAPFDLFRDPPFRLTLVPGSGFSDLILTVHHMRADGLSGVYLLRRLLECLGGVASPAEAAPLPPSMFDSIPEAVRARLPPMAALAAAATSTPAQAEPRYDGLPRDERPAWKRFRVLTAELPPSQTARLAAACKAHDVTVHSALCAAWLKAQAADEAEGADRPRKVSSPINLRGRLSVPIGEAFGTYMSTVVQQAECVPDTPFWDVARELGHGLKAAAADERPYLWILGLQAVVLSLPPAARAGMMGAFAQMPVDYDFSISDLGRLDWPTRFGSVEVQVVHGPAVNTSEQEKTVGAVTFAGRLTLTLSFRDFVVHPDTAARLLAQAVWELNQAAG